MDTSRRTAIRRTEVFISAASADLKSARARVKLAVDTIGCHGVYQEEFPPDYREVEAILRSLIEKCDAVIHIAGVCYGSEPKDRPANKTRRSYTQMEYDIAQELGRPLYVFVCTTNFPYSGHSPEAADVTVLQAAHRAACMGRKEMREEVGTLADLERRVSQLQEHFKRLERQIVDTSEAIREVGEKADSILAIGKAARQLLRSELRAKLSHASVLHARDEVKQAVALMEETYHAAQANGLKEEQLEAVLCLGFTKSQRQDSKIVEKRLREAEKLIRAVKVPWLQLQFYRLKAKVLGQKGYTRPAENALKKAIELGSCDNAKTRQIGLVARADYVHLLCNNQRVNEADAQVDLIRKAIETITESASVAFVAECLEACIHWAVCKSDLEQLKRLVAAALRHGADSESAICISHALHNCANGAQSMRATEAVIVCAEAAERLGRIARRPDISMAAGFTAAGALGLSGKYHEARERCIRLLETFTVKDHPSLRFAVAHLLSGVCLQLGDKTTALTMAEEALRNVDNQPDSLCMAKLSLAEALCAGREVRKAIDHAQDAASIARESNLPLEVKEQAMELLVECAAMLGDWQLAEEARAKLNDLIPGYSSRTNKADNRIQMFKAIRDSLESVMNTPDPLTAANFKSAPSLHAVNAFLVEGVVEAWKKYPRAASAIFDYWGRGNLTRAMLNMRAFPDALKMTIEVTTVEEARRAVRLWALIADVLVLVWKGKMNSHSVLCPVPMTMKKSGGGGYLAMVIRGAITNASLLNGTDVRAQADESAECVTPFIFTPHASLLPYEIGEFMSKEALELFASGRLVVVPSTGIGSVAPGHSFVDSLFAEACDALPAIKGNVDNLSPAWIPFFPDAPLEAIGDVLGEHEIPLSRLRRLLFRRAREYRTSGVVGSEAKELEMELRDALAELNDAQAALRRKYSWSEAAEPVASRYDGFTAETIRPIFVLQNMGYRWRVERVDSGLPPQPGYVPKADEPVCTWLHPPDTVPRFVTPDEVEDAIRASKSKKKRRMSKKRK